MRRYPSAQARADETRQINRLISSHRSDLLLAAGTEAGSLDEDADGWGQMSIELRLLL